MTFLRKDGLASIARELRDEYPPVDVTTVIFSRDFAGIGCCVIPQDRVLEIAATITSAETLLSVIARGCEVGITGRIRKLSREDLIDKARDYCDVAGISYALKDLKAVEREPFFIEAREAR